MPEGPPRATTKMTTTRHTPPAQHSTQHTMHRGRARSPGAPRPPLGQHHHGRRDDGSRATLDVPHAPAPCRRGHFPPSALPPPRAISPREPICKRRKDWMAGPPSPSIHPHEGWTAHARSPSPHGLHPARIHMLGSPDRPSPFPSALNKPVLFCSAFLLWSPLRKQNQARGAWGAWGAPLPVGRCGVPQAWAFLAAANAPPLFARFTEPANSCGLPSVRALRCWVAAALSPTRRYCLPGASNPRDDDQLRPSCPTCNLLST